MSNEEKLRALLVEAQTALRSIYALHDLSVARDAMLSIDKALGNAAEHYRCPKCKGAMVKRQTKIEKAEFFGCSQFPKCRGSRSIDGRAPKPPQGYRVPGLSRSRGRHPDPYAHIELDSPWADWQGSDGWGD